jgi:hypothetical protein
LQLNTFIKIFILLWELEGNYGEELIKLLDDIVENYTDPLIKYYSDTSTEIGKVLKFFCFILKFFLFIIFFFFFFFY